MNTPMKTSAWWMPAAIRRAAACADRAARRSIVAGPADQHGGQADEAVQQRDQLRHAGHLDDRAPATARSRRRRPSATTSSASAGGSDVPVDGQADGRGQRDRHADDAEDVARRDGLVLGQAGEGQDEQQGRDDVARPWRSTSMRHRRSAHLREHRSMRRVTAKPPKMLMLTRAGSRRRPARVIDRVAVADLQQRADDDDAGDGVGHPHQRRVQRVVHVPDHVVADDDRQHEHGEVLRISWSARTRRRTKQQHARRRRRSREPALAASSALLGLRLDRRPRRLRRAAARPRPAPAAAARSSRRCARRSCRAARRRRSRGRAGRPSPASQLHQVDQVGAVQLRGLRGQAAGQVGVADDRHAVVGDDGLARDRALDVAAVAPRPCRRSRCPASSLATISAVMQLRRGLAGDQRGGDDDVDVLGLLGVQLAPRAPCSPRTSPWRSRSVADLAASAVDRRGTRRPATCTWSATSGRGSVARTMAPRLDAAPIAARPATPAPATSTLAGGTLPAAVTWPVKKRPNSCAASTTAR